ncbi:hypothetical protein KBC89_02680, partial [Candidatus Woesebacteria bacterium]|nr:hypothetical protein [Candidatus Woesebacteria bacterium]
MQKPSIHINSLIIAFALFLVLFSPAFAQTASDSSLITETTDPSGTPTVTPVPPPVNPINLTLSPIT